MSCYGYQEKDWIYFWKLSSVYVYNMVKTQLNIFLFFFNVTSRAYVCVISGMSGLANVTAETNFIFKLEIIIAFAQQFAFITSKIYLVQKDMTSMPQILISFLSHVWMPIQDWSEPTSWSASPSCTSLNRTVSSPPSPFPSGIKLILEETLPY